MDGDSIEEITHERFVLRLIDLMCIKVGGVTYFVQSCIGCCGCNSPGMADGRNLVFGAMNDEDGAVNIPQVLLAQAERPDASQPENHHCQIGHGA